MKKYLLLATFLFVPLIIVACTTVADEEGPILELAEEVQTEPTATEVEADPTEIIATAVPATPNPTDPPAPTSTKPVEETTEEPTLVPTMVEVTEESGPEDSIPEQADNEASVESDGENDPVVFGRTAEGAFFYGSPSAEITLIDYSEFL